MSVGKRLLWSGLGWAFGGPIGAIIGYSIAGMFDSQNQYTSGHRSGQRPTQTRGGDFMVSVLVLLGSVMKADKQLLKAELNYVKQFLQKQFSPRDVQDFMTLFKDILKQDYPLRDVCRQIQRSMDHPSRLELIHILFGLSQADGHIHPDEIKIIHTIARYLNVSQNDFVSIKAMFVKDTNTDYKILEIESGATDSEIKKAYRHMASKYHPDKVTHLGEEFRVFAEEKFKSVNEAYQNIKKERAIL
ncbi:MAG: TerB family tellurite resistance protein [Candidatus Marinimicrobia bacterium]|nr:TerB family tellurite resistance protein [Candidatus Neomarinimicrobiota bacterium]